MADIPFETLARHYPERLAPRLLELYQERGQDGVHISPSAKFDPNCSLDLIKNIGAGTTIGAGVRLGREVSLGRDVKIWGQTILGRGVKITNNFSLGIKSYIANGASVDQRRSRVQKHEYLRITEGNITIGQGVALPDEVQLGSNAIIPTNDTIGQIGRFGTTKRMLTAYGSDDEPLVSVGCQYGITIADLKGRVSNHTGTSEASAADYARHMPEIEALGLQVQAAYEREGNLIEELVAQRDEAFANAGIK